MNDGMQLSSGGGGLCRTHQVILSIGERPVLGRKTRQDVQAPTQMSWDRVLVHGNTEGIEAGF